MARNTQAVRKAVLAAPPRALPRITTFGIQVTVASPKEALEAILAATPKLVFFCNQHAATIGLAQPDFVATLNKADLCFADGVGMAIAHRVLGHGVVPRVNGTDLFPLLLDAAEDDGLKVFFLGANDAVLAALLGEVRRQWPRLRVAGSHSGYFSDAEAAPIAEGVARTKPDLLFVARGMPLQEQFLVAHRKTFGQVRAALAVGGLFDFYSGLRPRAPIALQRVGLEWAWRMSLEPRRLARRYLVGGFFFLWAIARASLR